MREKLYWGTVVFPGGGLVSTLHDSRAKAMAWALDVASVARGHVRPVVELL